MVFDLHFALDLFDRFIVEYSIPLFHRPVRELVVCNLPSPLLRIPLLNKSV